MPNPWTYLAISAAEAEAMKNLPDHHVWWLRDGQWTPLTELTGPLPAADFAVVARGSSALTAAPGAGIVLYAKKDPIPPPPPSPNLHESLDAYALRIQRSEPTNKDGVVLP